MSLGPSVISDDALQPNVFSSVLVCGYFIFCLSVSARLPRLRRLPLLAFWGGIPAISLGPSVIPEDAFQPDLCSSVLVCGYFVFCLSDSVRVSALCRDCVYFWDVAGALRYLR